MKKLILTIWAHILWSMFRLTVRLAGDVRAYPLDMTDAANRMLRLSRWLFTSAVLAYPRRSGPKTAVGSVKFGHAYDAKMSGTYCKPSTLDESVALSDVLRQLPEPCAVRVSPTPSRLEGTFIGNMDLEEMMRAGLVYEQPGTPTHFKPVTRNWPWKASD